MTAVPYVCFDRHVPVDADAGRAALAAVGRCRIHPRRCAIATTGGTGTAAAAAAAAGMTATAATTVDKYGEIVAANRDQALVDLRPLHVEEEEEEQEAEERRRRKALLRKKHMKRGVALCSEYLRDVAKLDASVVDVDVYLDGADVIETDGCLASCVLDAGCSAVVMDGANVPALDAAKIPKDRLIGHFNITAAAAAAAASSSSLYNQSSEEDPVAAIAAAAAAASQFCGSVSIEISHEEGSNDTDVGGVGGDGGDDVAAVVSKSHVTDLMRACCREACVPVLIQFRPAMAVGTERQSGGADDAVARLVGDVSGAIAAADSASAPSSNADDDTILPGSTVGLIDPTAEQLGFSYAACLKTDREDQLFTTVVCTRQGEALGLVYSNRESVVAALACGRGVYHSRSRGGLWRKGDTSGHYQQLHRLDTDCDGDAVRFTVTQCGEPDPAFCHLNTLTCWGRPRGFSRLERTVRDRVRSAPAGSYTRRLLDDPQLLRDKLVEEAQELSEADGPRHAAEELADVLYFAMVAAVKAGATMDDAVAELDRRSKKVTRRKGDSKAFRIAAGNAILEKKKNNDNNNDDNGK